MNTDRFGNAFAEGLPYARGSILPSTADDVALIGQSLGYSFSGDDLLRFNGQKVDKVTVRKVEHPGEYH